jgi:carbamoylphosphate synthase large subunit
MGDQHGNAVAFSGRDCSTQRRFQKIFEEAPPRVVPPRTFREMEKNAQKLTQSIGYQGAGTVEYLYNADEDKFYFLELNPRLQVEHPVTESITNVSPFCSLYFSAAVDQTNNHYFDRSTFQQPSCSVPWESLFIKFQKFVASTVETICMERTPSTFWKKNTLPSTATVLRHVSLQRIPTMVSSLLLVP